MNRRHFMQYGIAMPLLPYTFDAGNNNNGVSGFSQIMHSVCQWCYNDIPLEELCERVKDIGIDSVELLHPYQWETVQSYGLSCAIGYANDLGLTKGFNDPALHNQLIEDYFTAIKKAGEMGIPQIIAFPGNRNGLNDEEGLENCARGLDSIVKFAEKEGVIITMELMNSKIDHPDYQADSTEWGVALVEKLGSSHFKLLYDIYHMQIMEGDIIRTIQDNIRYFSHFHTAGVPGRHELDGSQELNYNAICKAIKDTGFSGYIAQEFIPTKENVFESLAKSVQVCNV